MRRFAAWMAVVVTMSALGACSRGEPTLVGLPYSDYAHEGEPFARDLFGEQATLDTDRDPEVFYTVADMERRYTHVHDLERRSAEGPSDAPIVWFLGGSTMFGIGQRDDHTIESDLVRIADEAGTPIRAANYGWSSYVAWQEVQLLDRLLAEHPHPDAIVFLHGINDLSQVCRHLAAGIPAGTRTNPMTDKALDQEDAVFDCYADTERSAEVLADVVNTSMDAAERMAGPIPILEYWQATAATRAPHPSDAGLLERLGKTSDELRFQNRIYLAALHHDDTPPIDLTDALDDVDEPMFFDWAHTNEAGAQIVAQAMWDRGLADVVAKLH